MVRFATLENVLKYEEINLDSFSQSSYYAYNLFVYLHHVYFKYV